MDNKANQSFEYTYSAPQRAEIQQIRQKYLPKQENKMETLRRLDQSATRRGTIVSLICGIVGILMLGGGMSAVMIGSVELHIPGVILGIIGLALVAAAYPLYGNITRKERDKIAPEILRLTDELLK